MEEVKTKKRKGSLLLKIAVFCLAAFLVALLVGQGAAINARKARLAELDEELEAQRVVNDGLRYEMDNGEANSDEYAERIARRDLGYVYPGERVFYNVGGNN